MTLTLTPEQERKVKTLAQHRRKPTEAILNELIPDVPTEMPEPPKADATPEEIAAYVEARRAIQREKNKPILELLSQWREEDAAMTEEEKNEATEQVNAFLANLQANRVRIGDDPLP